MGVSIISAQRRAVGAAKMSYTSDASPITLVKEDGQWTD
jgi:hypothetical protein